VTTTNQNDIHDELKSRLIFKILLTIWIKIF